MARLRIALVMLPIDVGGVPLTLEGAKLDTAVEETPLEVPDDRSGVDKIESVDPEFCFPLPFTACFEVSRLVVD